MNLTALQPCQLCETKYIVDVAFTALEYCDTNLNFVCTRFLDHGVEPPSANIGNNRCFVYLLNIEVRISAQET
jgi:hypothetical protein